MAEAQDHSFVDELDAEHDDLEALLGTLGADEWLVDTPAAGWTVRDSMSHLADTEDIARHTSTGGPRALALESQRTGNVIQSGVDKGRAMSGDEVREWFGAAAAYNRAALRRVDLGLRVPWGLGMSWRTFVTARMMEAWAHGLDVRAAVGRPGVDTDRLRHIAWLSSSSLPYAFRVAGVDAPEGHTLRLELEGPSGDVWRLGPDDATDVVRGSAGVWCRRAVQRMSPEEADAIERDGPLAELAFRNARCFL